MNFFTHSLCCLPAAPGAVSLHMKTRVGTPRTVDRLESGNFVFDTADYAPGTYYYQQTGSSGVLTSGTFDLLQSIEHAEPDFDPRTPSEITLDAIDAMLAGRATEQQRRVQVGDKSIEYSSFSELQQWRSFFRQKIRAERGQKSRRRELMELK